MDAEDLGQIHDPDKLSAYLARSTDAGDNLCVDGTTYRTQLPPKFRRRKPYVLHDQREVRARIPGTIVRLLVRPGQEVERGRQLLIVEAMKMQNAVLAPCAGRVKAIHVEVGQQVPKGTLLAELE